MAYGRLIHLRVITIALLCSVGLSEAASVSWNADVSGFWDDTTKWSSGMVPQPGDDVTIDRAGADITVTFRTGSASIKSLNCKESFALTAGGLTIDNTGTFTGPLNMSGGRLDGTADFTVAGLFTWSAGTVGGSGTLTANGGMALTLTSSVAIDDTRTIVNAGTANWTGAGSFFNSSSAQFNNTGTLNLQSNGDFFNGLFNNNGAVTKVTGTGDGISRFTGTFNNNNSVTVSSGSLQLDNGGTHVGSFSVPAGTLQFGNGTHNMQGNFSLTAAGTVELAGGTSNLNGGTYNVTGTTKVLSGTSTFTAGISVTSIGIINISGGIIDLSSGEAISTTSYTQSAGQLLGTDTVTVNGTLTWSGGTMGGSGTTEAKGPLNITAASSLAIADTRVVTNAATATWTGAGSFFNEAGGQFNNLATGIFNINTSGDFFNGTFNNAGALNKAAGGGDGVTVFNGSLNNNGSITLTGGELDLNASSTNTGSYTVQAGRLELNSGTQNFNGSAFSGAGTVALGGGVMNFNSGSYNVAGPTVITGGTNVFDMDATMATLNQSGGALSGGGTVTVTGLLTWSAGQMNGTGTTNANGGMLLSATSSFAIGDTRMVNNAGTATWSGAGSFFNDAGGVFNNLAMGIVNMQTSGDFFNGTFNNAGALNKSAGSGDGISDCNGTFNNSGLVTITGGTLRLSGGGTHTGPFAVQAGTLAFNGGTHTLDVGSAVAGAGSVQLGNGSANFNAGMYNITGGTSVTAGAHTFNAGVTLNSVGNLSISGGTVDFSSGEAVMTAQYTQSAGTLVGSDTVTVTGPLTWSGGSMGGSGTTVAGATMQITAPSSLAISDMRTVNGTAITNWTGAGSFFNDAGGQFVNTGTFNIQTSGDFFNGAFINMGTLTKVAGGGDGVTVFNGSVNNSGTVTVSGGMLELNGGGTHAGAFTVSAGTLQFDGGTHTFNDGTSVSGAGTLDLGNARTTFTGGTYNVTGTTRVSNGNHTFESGVTVNGVGNLTIAAGQIDFSSGESISTPQYTQSGGTLKGTDTVTATGMMTWSAGNMGGSGTTVASAGLQLTVNNSIGINDTRTVNNAATATWTGPGSFFNDAGASFVNLASGTFNIQTQGDFFNGNLVNAGTLTKTLGGGDGVTAINGAIENSGTFDVHSGSLQASGGYHQTAGETRLSGGALSSTTTLNIDGGSLTGTGTFTGNVANKGQVAPGLSPGLLNIAGMYQQGDPGTLAVEIGGATAGTQFDKLVVTQAATLAGNITATLVNGFTPNVGDHFQIMTFPSHTGDFAAGEVVVGNGQGFKKLVSDTDVVLEFVEENCTDGQDNDNNGFTDCDDPKCSNVPICMGTPTPTRTRTPGASATPTRTATPVPSSTPTLTATRTPPPCAGDCDISGTVDDGELSTGLAIALGDLDYQACLDADDNQEITVDDLVADVANKISHCGQFTPAPPTQTPTRTPTGGGTVPTATPAPIAAVAGNTSVLVDAMVVFPSIVTAIADGIAFGGAAAIDLPDGGGAGACPLGGSASRVGNFPLVTLSLNNCKVPTADGSETFNGTAGVMLSNFNVNIQTSFDDMVGTETRHSNANFSGTVSITPSFTSCLLTAATLTVTTGMISSTTPDGTTTGLTFGGAQGTQIIVSNISFSAACVPELYRLTFNRDAALLAPQGDPVPVTFTNLVVDVDDRADPTLFRLNGGLTSQCFGGAVTLITDTALSVPHSSPCPIDGAITVMPAAGGTGHVFYRANQSVDIDLDGNGSIDLSAPNCLDERLLMCVA